MTNSGLDLRQGATLIVNTAGEGKGVEGMGRGIQIDLADFDQAPGVHLQPFVPRIDANRPFVGPEGMSGNRRHGGGCASVAYLRPWAVGSSLAVVVVATRWPY